MNAYFTRSQLPSFSIPFFGIPSVLGVETVQFVAADFNLPYITDDGHVEICHISAIRGANSMQSLDFSFSPHVVTHGRGYTESENIAMVWHNANSNNEQWVFGRVSVPGLRLYLVYVQNNDVFVLSQTHDLCKIAAAVVDHAGARVSNKGMCSVGEFEVFIVHGHQARRVEIQEIYGQGQQDDPVEEFDTITREEISPYLSVDGVLYDTLPESQQQSLVARISKAVYGIVQPGQAMQEAVYRVRRVLPGQRVDIQAVPPSASSAL